MTRFWYHYINQFSFFKLHTPCPIPSSPLLAHSHSTHPLSTSATYSPLGNTSNALRHSRPETQPHQRQRNAASHQANDSELQHKADNSNNHQNSQSNTRIRNSNYRIPTKNIPATTPHQKTKLAESNLLEKDERKQHQQQQHQYATVRCMTKHQQPKESNHLHNHAKRSNIKYRISTSATTHRQTNRTRQGSKAYRRPLQVGWAWKKLHLCHGPSPSFRRSQDVPKARMSKFVKKTCRQKERKRIVKKST